ncbi:MAG TPA: polysaccharide pyruvyl transferase family protein [Chthoniobacterales bacterium]|nr:polysaccharide pyruvyl transferase family protein [Candidatus Acidoferrales bacterium]HXA10520.1 polysaccharide pyruvyl transferase family protein [Chthoniobacterales bacterium]
MTDFLLVAWVSAMIEFRRFSWMFGIGKRWTPGEKLKLLFAGYNGTRNTGSDVRVQETLRQIRHVLGAHNVDLSVMTQSFDRTQGYFEGSRQVHLPDVFPPFLFREVHANHGVVACEGSMFKSKFANALTTMMIGSLGLASAENKLSVAYAGDAGHMDDLIEWMCARYTRESLVITRSLESQQLLSGLGVPNELGADTAWTFEPRPPDFARNTLRKAGWDEKTPILVLCPIHPFVWPVRASIAKYIARVTTGAYRDSQYRTVYFFESGAEVDRKFNHYVAGYAQAAKAFLQRHKVFPILVAMERLDAVACRAIEKEIPGTPIFTSDDYDMFELVSILRACTYMVSSRYHGIVTCMPAGVVSAGVTMDERIRNLMRERGHQHLLLNVDDPDLGPKLLDVMEKLVVEADSIRDSIGRTVVSNLKAMSRMAVFFEDEIRKTYPEFPLRKGVLSWEDNLPPFSDNLRKLVEQYDSSPAVLAAGR